MMTPLPYISHILISQAPPVSPTSELRILTADAWMTTITQILRGEHGSNDKCSLKLIV